MVASAVKLLLAIIGVAIGVAAIVLGESDDSPGLQGLGVLLVAGTIVLAVRAVRRSRQERSLG